MNEVLLIDLSSLFWSAWHATEKDISSDAVAITMAAVRRCAEHMDAMAGTFAAVCVDQGRSFRKALAPEYKATRPEKDHAALNQLADVKRKLVDAGYLLWGADGFEADDIIATAATQASAKGHPVRICTSDKDLLQLLALPLSSVVRTYNTWDTWRSANVVEKFGVEPDGLGDWLALVGDKSDNIEGAAGVGPVTAKALLIAHYDIDTLYERINALLIPGGGIVTKTPEAKKIATPAVLQSLWDNRDKVMLARKLVTLRTDAPIKFNQIYEKREPKAAQEIADMDDAKFEDDRISAAQEKVIGLASAAVRSAEGDGVAREVEQEIRAGLKEDAHPKAASSAQSAEPATPVDGGTNGLSSTKGVVETALVPTQVTAVAFERELEPRSLGQLFKLSAELYKAGLYSRFPTPQALAAVMMRGREMNVGAMASLDVFHVIEGRPSPSAHFIIGLAEQHHDCEYFMLVHSDNEYAEYETKNRRHPSPIRHRYDIQDAIDAGCCDKEIKPWIKPADPKADPKDRRGQWDKRRKDMLRKTAGVQLARIAYPTAAIGLYAFEELGGGA